MRWAVAHQADVINLSVATDRRLGPELTDALGEAWDAGAIPVLAAGNRGNRPLFFDARSAVFVTATDRRGQLAPYAPSVDVAALGLAAPGGTEGDTDETCHIGGRPVGILSTYALRRGDRSGYACMAGTSMAAPQVSGGLALLLSMGFTRDEALERIVTTARPGAGLGAGRIDLAAAVAGPLPLGVRNRHDALLGSVDAHDTALSQAPTTGPFSVPRSPGRSGPPLWLAMAGGGLAVGLLAEVTLRVVARCGAEPAGPPPGDG